MHPASGCQCPEGALKRRSPAAAIKNFNFNDVHSLSPPYQKPMTGQTKGNIKNSVSGVSSPKLMSKCDKDIVRIIGQHLQGLGFKQTVDQLILESGCLFEHPLVADFRQLVTDGQWEQAKLILVDLEPFMTNPQGLLSMKFHLMEQKYMELLESGYFLQALDCLRNEITPLKFKTERVHELSFFVVCQTPDELYNMSKWEGRSSRDKLVDLLQGFLPPSVMLPTQRLTALLNQAVEMQKEKCLFHNTKRFEFGLTNVSLLSDHICTKESFPCKTLQLLTDHIDEVWFCRFSPDGSMLATGCKDGTLIIWSVDLETMEVKNKLSLNQGPLFGVSYLAWSPDSKSLIGCGTDDSSDLIIWSVETGQTLAKVNHSSEDSLTCAAWFDNGESFVTAGTKGQFYLCDTEGRLLKYWSGVRTQCLTTLSDETVLLADTHNRIRSYNFADRKDTLVIQEENAIMSFTVNDTQKLALLNVATQGLHLWDLEDKCLVRKFRGVTQGFYTIHSCFGGTNSDFLASGSEDHKVYIFHKNRETPITILEGHTGTVNCVHWNPVLPSMLASVSDDSTIRIWGPSFPEKGEPL